MVSRNRRALFRAEIIGESGCDRGVEKWYRETWKGKVVASRLRSLAERLRMSQCTNTNILSKAEGKMSRVESSRTSSHFVDLADIRSNLL